MRVIYYIEKDEVVLCQLVKNVPSVGDTIKIKGCKGKVLNVSIEGNKIIAIIQLEKQSKMRQSIVNDKRRR